MITSQITLAKTRKERGQRLRERVAKLEAALEQIASCEKRCDGDVVDIARKALSGLTEKEMRDPLTDPRAGDIVRASSLRIGERHVLFADECNVRYLAVSAEWAYKYARDVVRGRWPEGEPVIMQSAEWAYWYAYDVVKGRWPEGEPAIAQANEWAYWYANGIVKGRWAEGEPAILQSAEWSYRYARDVVKGRWVEAEPVIMQSDKLGLYYAVNVLRGAEQE